MASQTCPFDNLESEIFGEILQWIDAPADLCNLCLTSRSFRNIVEPFLYSRFVWHWTRLKADDDPTNWISRTVSLTFFLRTLLERSDLADHVREVELLGDGLVYTGGMFGTWINHPQPVVSLQEMDLSKAERYIEALNLPFTELWRSRLRLGTVDALAALLLVQVPRLRHLSLDPNFAHDSWVLGHLLRSTFLDGSTNTSQPFADLREVTYKLLDGNFEFQEYESHTACALMLFYLPKIRRLSVALDFPTTLRWPYDPPVSSTMRDLELTLIRESGLLPLLKATPMLKTLRWQYYSSEDPDHPYNPLTIDLDVLGFGLSQVKYSLTALTIRSNSHMTRLESEYDPSEFRGSLTALFTFECLRSLDINLEILAASHSPEHRVQLKSVIPRCLQNLNIAHEPLYRRSRDNGIWDPASVHNFLVEWLAEIDPVYFDLRHVSLELQVLVPLDSLLFGDWWSTATCRELRALCSSHGLELDFMTRTKDPRLCRWVKDI